MTTQTAVALSVTGLHIHTDWAGGRQACNVGWRRDGLLRGRHTTLVSMWQQHGPAHTQTLTVLIKAVTHKVAWRPWPWPRAITACARHDAGILWKHVSTAVYDLVRPVPMPRRANPGTSRQRFGAPGNAPLLPHNCCRRLNATQPPAANPHSGPARAARTASSTPSSPSTYHVPRTARNRGLQAG